MYTQKVGSYDVGYEEERVEIFKDWVRYYDYVKVVEVFKNNELILSSRDKSRNEFENYLTYLVDECSLKEIMKIYDVGETQEAW